MEQIIADAIRYIQEVFRDDFSGHDAAHSLRVYKAALAIAAEEQAERERLEGLFGETEEQTDGTVEAGSE